MSDDIGSTTLLRNDLLIQPNRKKNFGFPKCYPLPIVRDSDKATASWNCVIGHLKEHSVEVHDENDIELLFTQGFYGKGTLSRSTPQALEKKFRANANSSKSQKETGQSQNSFLSLSLEGEDKDKSIENPAKRQKKEEIEVLLSDTNGSKSSTEDDSNSTPAVATVSSTTKEALQLSLEEAFFLSYGCGVLIVKDKDQPLDLMRLWHKFCEIHPTKNFPVMYTAYHHFRSKGWIVRSGIKYGCDFVLYKDGPPFYHSCYAVIVKPVKEKNFRDVSNSSHPNLSWASLAAVHRICSHASKGVLILYVIKPASISENKISTPFCVSQYQLKEVLINRWVPSEEQRTES